MRDFLGYFAGSAGGISAAQLNRLKTRLEATKATLQNGNTQAIQNLSGEQISGDLLSATIWSWFAAAESHNRLSQGQAGMIEVPGLSYGLFHAVAQPVYSWGVIRQVKFPGGNLDIGHVRTLGWASDNDPGKWKAYNRLRGQYMSALEHAVPERFFNNPSQCNPQGTTTPTAGLPDCPKGISAVSAIGTAAQVGQKIYTLTAEVYNNNPNIVNTALGAHSAETKSRVQAALDAGYEVTIHEAPITISGWAGAGYTVIDPDTGAGGYFIEGGSGGGWFGLATDSVGLLLGVLTSSLQALVSLYGLPIWASILLGVTLALATQIIMIELAGSDPLAVNTGRTVVLLAATYMAASGFLPFNVAATLALSIFAALMAVGSSL